MDGRPDAATAMTKRVPSHVYARAYRALLEARLMLQDPQRYLEAIPYEERWSRSLWEVSRAAYEVAMKVSAVLGALPEFSPERVDDIYAACWKLNPSTGARGDVERVEAAMVEVWRLCDEAAREETGAATIVPVQR